MEYCHTINKIIKRFQKYQTRIQIYGDHTLIGNRAQGDCQ